MMSDTAHEYWRQLDERGRQQIGDDERPGAGHRVGSAAHHNPTPIVVAATIYFLMLWPVVRLLSRLENRALAAR